MTMRPKHKRLSFILLALVSISIGLMLLLSAFQKNIVFFVTPSEALTQNNKNKSIRIGGVVRPNSLRKKDISYYFDLMDKDAIIAVEYKGLLPDLFKEGRTIVAQGKLMRDNVFLAKEVLAKHDENYQPLELRR